MRLWLSEEDCVIAERGREPPLPPMSNLCFLVISFCFYCVCCPASFIFASDLLVEVPGVVCGCVGGGDRSFLVVPFAVDFSVIQEVRT